MGKLTACQFKDGDIKQALYSEFYEKIVPPLKVNQYRCFHTFYCNIIKTPLIV